MRLTQFAVATLILALPGLAEAKPTFPAEVPNGLTNVCGTCHTNPAGGTATDPALNSFGTDAAANVDADGAPIWADLCGLDSDGDGLTNGAELGDTDCTWQTGNPDPEGNVTHPGDASDPPPATGDGDGGDDGGCQGAPASAPWAAVLFLGLFVALNRRQTT